MQSNGNNIIFLRLIILEDFNKHKNFHAHVQKCLYHKRGEYVRVDHPQSFW